MLDPYRGSEAARKTEPGSVVSILDLDGTMAVSHAPLEKELEARRRMRAFAESKGPLVFSTARTPELVMSRKAHEASVSIGFTRPEARWSTDASGKRVSVPLEGVPFFEHLLDPDAINAFGTGIFLRHGHGYAADREYAPADGSWRSRMMGILELVDHSQDCLAAIEREGNYENGIVDVSPLPHRIQLEFSGPSAFADMVSMKLKLAELGDLSARGVIPDSLEGPGFPFGTLKDMVIVDESNPAAGRYVIYLMPRRSPKQASVERIVRKLCEASGTPAEDLSLFIAGDTLTDLRCGLYAGAKARGTFVLASGSRIAPYVSPRGTHAGQPFAGQPLAWLKDKLKETNRQGFYRFKPPMRPERTVIIGSEAFPGTIAPESVLRGAEESLH